MCSITANIFICMLQRTRSTLRSSAGLRFGIWKKTITTRGLGRSGRKRTTSTRSGSASASGFSGTFRHRRRPAPRRPQAHPQQSSDRGGAQGAHLRVQPISSFRGFQRQLRWYFYVGLRNISKNSHCVPSSSLKALHLLPYDDICLFSLFRRTEKEPQRKCKNIYSFFSAFLFLSHKGGWYHWKPCTYSH